MKKLMKCFVSLLVVAMMIVLVPIQQVHAGILPDYLFIEDSSTVKPTTDFEELTQDEVWGTIDSYGATHAFGYGYFKDTENENKKIFAFVYGSDRVDNKADYFVVETLRGGSDGYVGADEQFFWEIYGEEALYLEFEFNKSWYNAPYIYFYVGIYDSMTDYKDYAKLKVKNPYYNIPIASINIPSTRNVVVGKTIPLDVSYYPEVVTMDKTITWTSSNESVATVNEHGVVTGVSAGSAVITATSVNGKTDTCEVTVGDALEAIAFEKDSYDLVHSATLTLEPILTPSTAMINYDLVQWEIFGEGVVDFNGHSYSNGREFRTIGPGTATIQATTEDGLVASCVVNVDAPITDVTISHYSSFTVHVGNTKDLGESVYITPKNTNHDKTLTWESSDESIATVDKHGVVTAISEGDVTITVTTSNGLTDTQEIHVVPAVVIEEVRISADNVNLFVDSTYQCGVDIYPTNPSISTELTWTSSNENVATVDSNGQITGISSGTCVICATSVNGISDTITVKVSEGATRIFGNDRYQTAFKVADTLKSQLKKDKFSSVIVASGTGFADALAGSYLSAAKEAPILMTDKKLSNINKLVDYINKNLAKDGTVYILGGTAAVSSRVDQLLSSYNVKRLYGNNRYATNIAILDEVMPTHYNGDLLICTGTNFADSLSVSATGLPIMLVGSHLTNEQRSFLSWSEVGHVYVIGGEAAVSKRLVNEIKNALPEVSMTIGGQEVDISAEISRIAGNSRYETSTMVANKFLPNAEKAVLAYAQNYPDGLSGGALAYAIKAPLLLTDGYNYSTTSKHTIKKGITSGFVLGGNGLVTDKAVRNIFGLTKDQVVDSK